jgi:hypothetical protein
MTILLFLLASYGVALSLTLLHIGAPYRWLGEKLWGRKGDELRGLGILVHCPACTAFWVGLAISYLWCSPALEISRAMDWHRHAAHAIDGLAACGFSWIVHVILVKLGQNDL